MAKIYDISPEQQGGQQSGTTGGMENERDKKRGQGGMQGESEETY